MVVDTNFESIFSCDQKMLLTKFFKNFISILALLSVEIETVVTTQYPLEITREALVALLSNCDVSNAALGNLGRQYGDAMKFLG